MGQVRRQVVGVGEALKGHAHQFLGAVAQDVGVALVHAHELARGRVHLGHTHGGLVEQCPKPVFALAPRLVGQLGTHQRQRALAHQQGHGGRQQQRHQRGGQPGQPWQAGFRRGEERPGGVEGELPAPVVHRQHAHQGPRAGQARGGLLQQGAHGVVTRVGAHGPQVVHGNGDPVQIPLAAQPLHQVIDPQRGGHRTHKTLLGRASRGVEHRHADDDARAVRGFLQQVERGRHHGLPAVAAVAHRRQVGGLCADVQPQHTLVAKHRPEVLGHKVFGPLTGRVDLELGQAFGGQRGVGPHPGLVGLALGPWHPAREGQVAHAGVPLAHLHLAGGPFKVQARQARVGGEKAPQPIDHLGMACDALAQCVGERPGFLCEAGLLNLGHRRCLMLRQPQTEHQAQGSHPNARHPMPITALGRLRSQRGGMERSQRRTFALPAPHGAGGQATCAG